MNRQAIVGLFTLLGLIALFAILLVIRNVGTGGRYSIGVHFKSAAGLHRGALVYESGVVVGVVQETRLLAEDFTVEVILGINNNVDIPRDARFLITAPLTGDTTVEILPPAPSPRAVGIVGPTPVPSSVALLPRQVLPIEQQPQGTNPATLSDLLEQGQGEVHRLDLMLSELEEREPKLLDSLQSTLDGANDLTTNGSKRLYALADKLDTLTSSLQSALDAGSSNLIDMTKQLDRDVREGGPQVNKLLGQLNETAVSLNQTVDQVKALASNPQVHQNLLDTTKGLAQTATTIAAITGDLHNVTSNPQTQAQLRDTVANVDAATQKLNALLKELGATSSVYGVDPGATPAPGGVPAGGVMTPGHVPGGTPPVASAAGASQTVVPPTSAPVADASPAPVNALRSRLSSAVKNLVALQIRLTEMGPYNPQKFTQPLIATPSNGIQSDFNLQVLPNGKYSLLAGANDVGTPQTSANFVLEEKIGQNFRVGGGMLYSNLGGLVQYRPPGVLGIEARVYDLRFPTLDAYGTVNVTHAIQLFGGERDITHGGRRSAFGLQLQF